MIVYSLVCTIYRQTKPDKAKCSDLIHPLIIPVIAWPIVTLGLVVGFLKFDGAWQLGELVFWTLHPQI
jgi:nitrate reductase NapE component